jgi:hypothetical protein
VATSNTTQIVFVREAVDDIGAYLHMWAAKKPLPQPDRPARTAADQAVERIDRALRLLVEIRSQLVAEITIEHRAWLALDEDPADTMRISRDH